MTTNVAQGNSAIGATRPHYGVLDGLRGVAAICVVIFHFSELVIWDYSKLWIGHGFLAVDFFFCLSGFVVGYAYDGRVESMGFRRFILTRLIRFQPMVVLGVLLGLVAFYANPFGVTPGYSPAKIGLLCVTNLLLIPFIEIKERFGNTFSLNAPSWSLLWEYVANVVFATVLYRLGRSSLIALTVIFAVLLCLTGHYTGNLSNGWSMEHFWVGGVRLGFSFSAGLLIYRFKPKLRTRIGFVGLAILLFLALIMPYAKGAWVREAAVIIVYFPLIIALGVGTEISPLAKRVCRVAGDISYPLYMTHYAFMWIWVDWIAKGPFVRQHLSLLIPLCTCGAVLFSWAVFKLYDEPLRGYLMRKLRNQPSLATS